MAYNALSGTVVANQTVVFKDNDNKGELLFDNAVYGTFFGEGQYLKNVARVVANDVNDCLVTLGNGEQSLVGESKLRFNGNRLYVNAPVTASALQLNGIRDLSSEPAELAATEEISFLGIDKDGNVLKSPPRTVTPINSVQFESGMGVLSGSSDLTFFNDNGTSNLILTGNLFVSGAVKAEVFDIISTNVVEINSTGSTNFGTITADTHNFVGSLTINDGSKNLFSVASSGGIITMGSGIVRKRHFTSEDYQILKTDYIIGVDSAEHQVIIYLPDASSLQSGHTFVIKDEGGYAFQNNIIIMTQVGQFVNNTNKAILQVPYSSFSIYCDGDKKFFSY